MLKKWTVQENDEEKKLRKKEVYRKAMGNTGEMKLEYKQEVA